MRWDLPRCIIILWQASAQCHDLRRCGRCRGFCHRWLLRLWGLSERSLSCLLHVHVGQHGLRRLKLFSVTIVFIIQISCYRCITGRWWIRWLKWQDPLVYQLFLSHLVLIVFVKHGRWRLIATTWCICHRHLFTVITYNIMLLVCTRVINYSGIIDPTGSHNGRLGWLLDG